MGNDDWDNELSNIGEDTKINISKLSNFIEEDVGGKIMLSPDFNKEIKNLIGNIKKKKPVGCDKIDDGNFIQYIDCLSTALKHIFNTNKFTGELPIEWIHGIVALISKKLDNRNINNYIPITITNIVYRIWGTVITNRMKPYVNILTIEVQTAYKIGKSTIDVLPPYRTN